MKRYSYAMDMAKAVLALLVIAIHVNPLGESGGGIYPLARIAVPMFFIFSGYFLFSKVAAKGNSVSIIKNFCTRNFKLYMVWFILLFPITAHIRKYFEMKPAKFVGELLLQFFLGSTFRASWFLSSLVIGGVIVWVLSEKLTDNEIIGVGIVLYILCCLTSNYYGFFNEESVLHRINELYPTEIYNSFPVSIIWMSIGKSFVNKEQSRIKHEKMWLIFFIILLFGEKILIEKFVNAEHNDCFFMLIPVCWLLFDILRSVDLLKPKYAVEIRAFSTIAYCVHTSIGVAFAAILKRCFIDTNEMPGSMFLYFVTVLSIIAFTKAVVILEEKGWKWLSYLH